MLKKTYCISIGDCFARNKISIKKYKELNHQEISRYQINKFLKHLSVDNVKVTFSNAKVKEDKLIIWGYYFGFCKTIVLYRHSVWVFLHELAHHLSRRSQSWQKIPPHGKIFNDKLKFLYDEWNKLWQT